MELAREQAFRRLGVLAIVLGGHVLLVLLFANSRQSDARRGFAPTEADSVLVLLDLERRAEEPLLKPTPQAPPLASVPRPRAERPRKANSNAQNESPSDDSSESTAISAPDASGGAPKVDWQLEMEITARAMAPKLNLDADRRCAEAERTRAPRPPGCAVRWFDKPWQPSGDFLKDMRDPNRPRSSVPDPLPPAFPTAPPRPEGYRKE